MLVTKADIAGIIPHAGEMCLLDGVSYWDESRIRCFSRTHREADNPLRVNGQIRALCGIEYAAQAMALHGGLAGHLERRPRAGYMTSLRDVVCREDLLDSVEGDLVVDAERLMGDEGNVIYRFAVRVGEIEILNGRAAVMLDADRAKA